MIAGKRFATVKKLMLKSYEDEDTSPAQLRAALRHFGIKADPAKPIGKRTYSDFRFDAALLGFDRYDGQGHWTVWDADRQKRLDPWPGGTSFECTHYVEIRR